MKYGSKEFAYAAPFADALVENSAFREWVVRRTKFAGRAVGVRLLSDEMKAKRTKRARTWWRSHYANCDCQGCRGKETDVLAVFEDVTGYRFALHVEVKQPTDGFKNRGEQASEYSQRATCWATPSRTPPRVLPHEDASTMLLCTRSMAASRDAAYFERVITFEDAAESFGLRFPIGGEQPPVSV